MVLRIVVPERVSRLCIIYRIDSPLLYYHMLIFFNGIFSGNTFYGSLVLRRFYFHTLSVSS